MVFPVPDQKALRIGKLIAEEVVPHFGVPEGFLSHRGTNLGARPSAFKLGECVFVKFPQDESGRLRKLSRPWHGPNHIVQKRDPDATVTKVYHPQHGEIQVHQSRLCKRLYSWVLLVWWEAEWTRLTTKVG